MSEQEIERTVFDVVIAGTGAGGATLGHALAARGRSVLFIERGKRIAADPSVVRGLPAASRDSASSLRYGWWPAPLLHRSEKGEQRMPPFLGCGTGGSTSLFLTVMDRFRPEDFHPRAEHPDIEGSTLPESWPIDYADLEPYYDAAERLYRVRGTPDPLHPKPGGLVAPIQANAKETAIQTALQSAGLHPYRLHMASERVAACTTCPAMLCRFGCKNDANRICVEPALSSFGAQLLAEHEAVQVKLSGRVASGLVCRSESSVRTVRARVFVIAAGALRSPLILRASEIEDGSGVLGGNLMMHQSDILLLSLRDDGMLPPEMSHGLMLMDYYQHQGTKLGNVHAHPVPMSSLGLPEGRASALFATVVEDLPYLHNRVVANPKEIEIEYQQPDELRRRSARLFELFAGAVGQAFDIRPLAPLGALNLSHFCGTCRFGDDPRTSVLDRYNRVHGTDNLYVVDGSFMPSSGGMNPSLTIAANALRVAAAIDAAL